MRAKVLYGIVLLGIIVAAICYFAIIPDLVKLIFQDRAPAWFSTLVNSFYPRFEVEKHRFDAAFFINKSIQIGFRFLIISVMALVFHYLFYHHTLFRKIVNGFWQSETSVRNIRILVVLFYTGMILFTADFWLLLNETYLLKPFYKPVSFLRLFPFPSRFFLVFWLALFHLSCLAVLFRFKSIFFSVVAAITFIYLQGLLYGFEKTDHTFATFTYAAILMPFLINSLPKKKDKAFAEGWVLKLIQLTISAGYLLAAIEKLLISGNSWFAAETLRYYLHIHPTIAGLWVAKSDVLCVSLQTGVIVFQLGFILIVFFPRLRGFFMLIGVIFHFGTVILMNVGGFFTPWLFVYIFFIDWSYVFPVKSHFSDIKMPF
jgi:hypothetical protein